MKGLCAKNIHLLFERIQSPDGLKPRLAGQHLTRWTQFEVKLNEDRYFFIAMPMNTRVEVKQA